MAAADLTDLASLKAWLSLPADAGPSDDLLSQLITAASGLVVDYLGRDVVSNDYLEVYDGTGAAWLMLRQAPITAVQSVSFHGKTITVMADPVAGTPGVLFNDRRLSLVGEVFPHGALVVVNYTAGFTIIPAAIAQAAMELAGEAFRRRDRIGQNSKSLGGQETVSFSAADMNAAIKTMLAGYRAVAPV